MNTGHKHQISSPRAWYVIFILWAFLLSGCGPPGDYPSGSAREDSDQHQAPSQTGLIPRPTEEGGPEYIPGLRPLAEEPVPASWDWREYNAVSSVKDQGSTMSCWAHASLASLESLVMVNGGDEYDLSEYNLIACNVYDLGCYKGGDDFRAAVHLLGTGAAAESCDPLSQCDRESDEQCNPECAVVLSATGWRFVANDVEQIKNAVYNTGPVYTTLYHGETAFQNLGPDEVYYSTVDHKVTHAVTIVGYDDDKPHAGGQGAWLIKNSSGEGWADAGFGWVAYGTARIGWNTSVFVDCQLPDPEEDYYFFDEYGGHSQTGDSNYGWEWGMVRFTPAAHGLLEYVDFWTVLPGVQYKIRVYGSFDGSSPTELLSSKDGVTDRKGYYSIPLDTTPVMVAGRDVYVAVGFKYGGQQPIPYDDSSPREPDRSYLSPDGSNYSLIQGDIAYRIRVVHRDTDGDGMADFWENTYGCLMPNTVDNEGDCDSDGLLNGDEYLYYLDPEDPDIDGDGIVDGYEVNLYGTDPTSPDSDSDGLGDYLEAVDVSCLDPNSADTDGEGLCDGGTSVYDGSTLLCEAGEDMDRDGEVDPGETDPCLADTDDDFLDDKSETQIYSTDPLDPDTDSDGVLDGIEASFLTDPLNPDTDGDGLCDGNTSVYDGSTQLCFAGEDWNNNGIFEPGLGETDPCNPDTDGDSLTDAEERLTYGTDPNLVDTDYDGIEDPQEVGYCTDPCNADTDGDGLCDGGTSVYDGATLLCEAGEDMDRDGAVDPDETDPCDPDTDNDNLDDGDEAGWCTHNLDPDTDGDGLCDGDTAVYDGATLVCMAGEDMDRDGATLGDNETDPCARDTDGDAVDDYTEYTGGSHPLDPRITPHYLKAAAETRISSHAGESTAPTLAWGEPHFGLAWVDDRDGNTELYFNRVSPGGTLAGEAVRVTHDPSESAAPSLVHSAGGFALAWHDLRHGDYQVYFNRLTNGGTVAGPGLRVTGPDGASSCPSLAWSGSEYAVSWQDDRDGNYEVYLQRISTGDTLLGAAVRVTQDGAGSERPSIGWARDQYGIVWTDRRDANPEVYHNAVSGGGTVLGADTRISEDPGESQRPGLSWTGAAFGVAWEDLRPEGRGVYFALLSEGAAAAGPELLVSHGSTHSSSPSLSWTGARFGVSWSDARDGNTEIYYAEVTPGSPVVWQQRITFDPAASRRPSIAWTGAAFGIAWEDRRDGNGEVYFALLEYDADGDGALAAEEELFGADPEYWDTDRDFMPDGWEMQYAYCGVDPLTGDSHENPDGDGKNNIEEYLIGIDPCVIDWSTSDGDHDGLYYTLEDEWCTSPFDPDTDGDGLCDGDTSVYDGSTLLCAAGEDMDASGSRQAGETDPCDPDSDGDGLTDGDEVLVYGTDPLSVDTDLDGLSDSMEAAYCTDPLLSDSDGDLVIDGTSAGEDSNNNGIFEPELGETDPCDPDSDDDGLSDGDELYTQGTDPLDRDSDDDMMPDGYETNHGLDPLDPGDGDPEVLDPVTDPDGDGNANVHEFINQSSPSVADAHTCTSSLHGCFFGQGNSFFHIDPQDLSIAQDCYVGVCTHIRETYPGNCDTFDISGDGIVGPDDISTLQSIYIDSAFLISGAPARMTMLSPGMTANANVGETVSIEVRIEDDPAKNNGSATPRSGSAAIFELVSGQGHILGGEAPLPAGRTLIALSPVNSSSHESTFVVSRDEKEIVLASNRSDASGGFNLFHSRRSSRSASFGVPEPLSVLNSDSHDSMPALTGDRLEVFLSRKMKSGDWDLYRATRPDTGSDFTAPAPVSELNSGGYEGSPSITADGLVLYYAIKDEVKSYQIWRAERPDTSSPFADPAPVSELNTDYRDDLPAISAEGKRVLFISDRPGQNGLWNIWFAQRSSISDPFSAPVELPLVNTDDYELNAWESQDGLRLYLATYAYDPDGDIDIFTVTRPSTQVPFWVSQGPGRYEVTGEMAPGPLPDSEGRARLVVKPSACGTLKVAAYCDEHLDWGWGSFSLPGLVEITVPCQ